MKIRLVKPFVGKEELDAVRDVFDRAWLGIGPKVREFERQWSAYIGCADSAALNSGTAALHLALWAYGFTPGKKVLVPAMTFVSTANAALYNRLEPVFVDVCEQTLQMDLEDLARKYTPDCVAVIPVHFGGHPVPMDRLMPFARARGLIVISDCAHCAGGEYQGKKLDRWADVSCYSFEEKKCLATGDGGMASSDDTGLIERIRGNRQVGMSSGTWSRYASAQAPDGVDPRHWYYEVRELGYKYNMNDLVASIGLAQLAKLDHMNQRRKQVIARYLEGLRDCRQVRPAFPYDPSTSYYDFMVRIAGKKRDEFIVHMQRRGIATGVHTMPVPLHPLYRDSGALIPTAMRIWDEYVVLPLFVALTAGEIDYVIEAIRAFDAV